jgi:hypothetical protein
MSNLRLVNWNIERRSPASWQSKSIITEIETLSPDIVCLTEAFEGSLIGNVIDSVGIAWSKTLPSERKVVLKSNSPWMEVQQPEEITTIGGFVSGITRHHDTDVRVIGICIPYRMASPYGRVRRSSPWEEHKRYLEALGSFLSQQSNIIPTVICGDFNRRIPRYGDIQSYNSLMDVFRDYEIVTGGLLAPLDEKTVDHVAINNGFELLTDPALLSSTGSEGKRRSDHHGTLVDLFLKT